MLIFALSNSIFSQIQNNSITDAGDIVFTAYHNNPDGFSFVFLDNCPAETTIRFVDEEWNGSAFASENYEGEILWTNDTNTTISQGTVIIIQNADDDINISASTGSAIEINSGFSIANTNDGIMAITGTRSSPGVFLAFFGDTTASSLVGTSLINGYTANQQSNYGTGYYSGGQNCNGLSITECSERLNNTANWTIESTFDYPEIVMSELDLNAVLKLKNAEKQNIYYYPNPVTDKLKILTEHIISSVQIHNILGQQVYFADFNNSNISIDLTSLRSGSYYIKCYSNYSSHTFKIQKL